jgi:hypothetical protein
VNTAKKKFKEKNGAIGIREDALIERSQVLVLK